MQWLRRFKTNIYKENIENFIKYGYYKDLLRLSSEAIVGDFKTNYNLDLDNDFELQLYANILFNDIQKMSNNQDISLAAKYAPSIEKSFDKKFKLGIKLRDILVPKILNKNISSTNAIERDIIYRKTLVSMRKN